MYLKAKDRELYANIDTSECKECKWHGHFEGEICCDYFLLTKQQRKCNSKPCNKFESANGNKKKAVPITINAYCQLSPKDAEEKKKRRKALDEAKEMEAEIERKRVSVTNTKARSKNKIS